MRLCGAVFTGLLIPWAEGVLRIEGRNSPSGLFTDGGRRLGKAGNFGARPPRGHFFCQKAPPPPPPKPPPEKPPPPSNPPPLQPEPLELARGAETNTWFMS